MTDRYHHGDLPNALRAAAVDVITEKGVGSFSLREVARRAGVSHAAPAHHFGDTTGLLTSLATEGLDKLHEVTAAAAEAAPSDPIERLTEVGRAYVSVAIDYPAHCEIIFRDDLIDTDQDDYLAAGLGAYGVLERAVGAVAAEVNPDLDVDDAAKLCWAAMQGLVVLHSKMVRMDDVIGREPGSLDDLVMRFTHLMVEGFRRC